MIKRIYVEDIEKTGALELVWRAFQEFVAPEYSTEGIQEFKDFINLKTVKKRLSNNELLFWGYFNGDTIQGVIAIKPPCHIALLFVDMQYHRKGIAKSLYRTVINFYKANSSYCEMTVNSSPYAVDAYHHLGFIDTDVEQTVNGIRFTPMKHKFR